MFELDKNTTNLVSTGITVGVGLLAWEYAAVNKYAKNIPSYNYLSKSAFEDALSGMIGGDLVRKIDKSWTGQPSPWKPTPLGAINKVSVGGIVLKIANMITRKWTEKYVDSIPDFIDAAANGLIAGGVIGGIFDPAGETQTQRGDWINIGNTPNPRADASNRIAVLV
jgi:hypothetical protein